MAIQLGCSTIVYREESLEVALAQIALHQFHSVDIGMIPSFCPHFNPLLASEGEKAKLGEQLKNMNLVVSTLNVCSGDLKKRDEEIKFIKSSLDLAKNLDTYAVTVQSSASVSPQDWLNVAKQLAKDFKELAGYAQSERQDLAIEMHKEAFIETPKQAMDFLDLVDRENIGVTFDPAHLVWAGIDPAKAIYQLTDLIKHVHIKDARGKDIHLSVGDGEVDFLSLFQALEQTNYTRGLTLEIEPLSSHLQDINNEVRKSTDYLNQIIGA